MPSPSGARVVMLAQGFADPGGCAVHGAKLADELVRRGYRVRVITRRAGGTRLERRREGALSVLEIPGFGRRVPGALLFLALGLPLALIGRRPRAFIGFGLAATTTVASLAAGLRGSRLLVLSTMTGENGEVAFVRNSASAPLRRALIRRASTLVAQTAEGAAELAELAPGPPVVTIPTPVTLPEVVPALNGRPTVAFSGRLVAQKNLLVLLEAWRAVRAAVPDAQLVLIGAGVPGDPTEARIRELLVTDSDLAASVSITGWVSDVLARLAEIDVYVFPSAFEGMSNALLEACALGRVIVASDISANRAVLGDLHPLLVPGDDPAALSDALCRALADRALRERAREHARARARGADIHAVGAALAQLVEG